MSVPMHRRVEVWAGIECSYNRVGSQYRDQLERSGAYDRPDDIDRLAKLGVKAVRFPVLWERVSTLGPRAWRWVDEGLARLRGRGLTPIVGLMHHGSGPRDSSLLDPELPGRLAAFARTVARRYPWVEHFTPINEPLTTARFSALYGHWYPHTTSPSDFSRAIVGQARAIGAAMRAIREVTPHARLIQTEDVGKTYASEVLRYQADFENERRWLTYDLLCGRVVGDHPMAAYLRWAGVGACELEALANAPCPPDVIGVNHYVTSERYLDDRIERYPRECHGGNHQHRYADVEAVRALGTGIGGWYTVLREAWTRYRRPIAITEAHLGCTREQQLRWLDEAWTAACTLRGEGAEIRALTVWSTFGAFDWASLLTRDDGSYEPGAFDIRAPRPRATAIAHMVRSLATHGEYDHPTLRAPGWWRRDDRLIYREREIDACRASYAGGKHHTPGALGSQPVLVVGASGTLGRAVVEACVRRGLEYRALGRRELDVTSATAVARTLRAMRPWAVVNCAGFVRVDEAERNHIACWRANVKGAVTLARTSADHRAAFVTFSSDLVFDGAKEAAYVESDGACPLSVYGSSKAEAERAVLAASDRALVVRTAAFFGHDDYNFVTLALRALANGESFTAMRDVVVSPTYVPDLVNATLDHLIDGERGVWHLANAGALTWEDLAARAARAAGVSTTSLHGITLAESSLSAPRPRFSALTSERGVVLPPIDDAIARYARAGSWARTRRPPAASGWLSECAAAPPSTITSGGIEGGGDHSDVVVAKGGTG